ncbi:MAG: hypothetical protein UY06_C0017G0008 [Candidatus Amesbacteria bacterium GW2011_GWA2_47_70]|nr:MAG: hypothetical protein UY06_C0017G0008 [Candidatus Amesbacteria bacterium GW2011_GWA2_47_70]
MREWAKAGILSLIGNLGKNWLIIYAADFENFGTGPPQAKEKSDSQKQNRKSAGIDAVYKRRNDDQGQEPLAAPADCPEKLSTARSKAKEKKYQKQNQGGGNEEFEFRVHGVTEALKDNCSGDWPLSSIVTWRSIRPTPEGPWAAGSKMASTSAD